MPDIDKDQAKLVTTIDNLLIKGFSLLLYNEPDKLPIEKLNKSTIMKSPLTMAVALGVREAFDNDYFDTIIETLEEYTETNNNNQAVYNENLQSILKTITTKRTDNDALKVQVVNFDEFENSNITSTGLTNNKTNFAAITSTNAFTELIKAIQDSDIENKFGKKIETLTKIFKQGGSFEELIIGLNSLAKFDKDTEKSITIISDIVSSLTDLSEFGLKKTIKAKLSIKLISDFLLVDVQNLLLDFIKVAKSFEINDNKDKIKYITDIINSITKIGFGENKNILLSRIRFKILKSIITKDIQSLLDGINNIKIPEDVTKNVENINNIINSVLLINKFKDLNVDDFVESEWMLSFIIDSYVNMINNIVYKLWDKMDEIPDVLVESITNNVIKINDIVNQIKTINDNIDISIILLLQAKLALLYPLFATVFAVIDKLTEINKHIITNKQYNKYELTFNNLNKILDKINSINRLISAKTLLILFIKLKITKTVVKNINDLINEINKLTTIHKDVIKIFKDKDDKDGQLTTIIKGLSDIGQTLENIKDINKFLKSIKTINLLVATIGKLLEKIGDGTYKLLDKQAEQLKAVIDKYGEIDKKDIEKAKNSAKAFLFLIGMTALALVGGAALMSLVKIENLITFIVTFGMFMLLMTYAYKQFSKESKITMNAAKAFALLMAVSGGVMLAGAMLFEQIDFGALILFTVSLIAFMSALSLPFLLFKKVGGIVMKGAAEFALLLVAAGGILIAGSLLFEQVNFVTSILFAISLTIFVSLLSLPFILFSETEMGENAMKGAGQFAILLVVAGGLLIAGSYMLDMMFHGATTVEKLWSGAKSLIFCILVGLFVWGLSYAITSNKRGVFEALNLAKGIALLVIVAGGLLIGGSYLFDMMFHGNDFWSSLWSGVKSILFCILVGLFIKFLVKSFTHNAGYVYKALPVAGAVALLVVISGGMLLLATRVIRGKADILKIIVFGVAIVALVNYMTSIIKKLSRIPFTSLAKSILALLAISGIIYILAKAMDVLSTAAAKLNIVKMLALLGVMAVVVTSVVTMVGGMIAALAFTGGLGAVLMAGGIAMVAALIGVVYMLADMMDRLTVVANKTLSKEKYEVFFDTSKYIISEIKNIIHGDKEHDGILNIISLKQLIKLRFVVKAIHELSAALSAIALAVKDWIDLKIPVYNGMKQTGWITIDKNEFKLASDNITYAVLSLLEPIDRILKYDKDGNYGLFEYSLIGGTKISRVMKGLKLLGPVLSSIAEGVKDWASLKIPEYTGAKQTGWITITNSHFKTASDNIAYAIESLINGVGKAYSQNEEAFKMDSINGLMNLMGVKKNTNPMIRVLKTIKLLGPALSSIASGVKDWVDLKIPQYNGVKQTGWITIGQSEFSIASKNIASTVTALIVGVSLAGSVMKTLGLLPKDIPVNVRAGIFAFSTVKKGSSPIMETLKAVTFMGMALGSVANGLKFWAGVKIPSGFDEKGNPTGYMSVEDMKTKVPGTIQSVLTALGYAIADTYNRNPEAFNVSKGSPAYAVSLSINLISGALANVAKVIAQIMSGQFQEYDKNGKPIGEPIPFKNELEDLKNNGENSKFSKIIHTILTTFGSTLNSIYENSKYKYIFNGAQTKSIAENIGISITSFTTAIKNVLNIITEFKKLESENPETSTESINSVFKTIKGKITEIISGVIDLYGLFANPAEHSTRSGIGEFFKGKQTVADWINENIDPIKNAGKAIKTYFDEITKIYTEIGNLQKNWDKNKNLVAKFIAKSENGSYMVTNNVQRILRTIINLCNIEEFDTLSDQLTEKFKTKISNVQNLSEQLFGLFTDKKKGLYNQIAVFKSELDKNSLQLSQIVNSETGETKDITSIITDLFTLYLNIIRTTSNQEDEILKQYNPKSLLEKTQSLITNSVHITAATTAIAITIKSYISNLDAINTSTKNIDEKLIISNLNKLDTIWTNIINKIKEINAKITNNNQDKSWFNSLFSSPEYGGLEELIKIVNDLIGVYNSLTNINVNTEPFDQLAQGISMLDIIGENLKGTENLKAHQDVLKKYVNTVNSINISKLKTLYNFAESMNRLADKFGNLDGLTDALGNKLTTVLIKLTSEMKKAEDVIKNADTLRAKREKLIKDSIRDMKNIMDQHLVVDIYNQSTSQSLTDTQTPSTTPEDTEDKSKGSTPSAPETTETTTPSAPLLKDVEKSNKSKQFDKNYVDINKQLADSISNALNNSLRNIFKYNGKENQYILNLKNKR